MDTVSVKIWGFGAEEIDIPADGRPCAEAKRAFTCGQCHAFALAISDLTGWPVYGCDAFAGDGIPNHVFALAPDGRPVDIMGAHAPADFECQWGSDWFPVSADDLTEWAENGSYHYPDTDAAWPYAVRVAREIEMGRTL